MNQHRIERVADRIWQELSVMLQQDVADPRVRWVTLAGVEVSRDFAYAKVYFTVLDETKAADAALGLKSAAGFLRSLLSKKLDLRTVPQLRFVFDDTTIRARKMDQLIDASI